MIFRALVAALAFATAAQAQDNACMKIEPDLDRLACYDKMFPRPQGTEVKPAKTHDHWKASSDVSALKDTKNEYLENLSNELVRCSSYGEFQKITMFLRCRENTTTIYIAGNCHLTSGHGGYGRVSYRVDKEKAGTINMDASTDNRALGLWSGRRAIPFIKKLIGKEKLIARFTPYGEVAVEVSFNLTGLEEAIKPLRKTCGW